MKKVFILIVFGITMQSQSAFAQLTASILPGDYTQYVCENTELNLDGNPSGGTAPYTHNWSGATAYLNSTSAQSVIFLCNTAGTYTLYYTVTDALLNSATDSVKIIVKPNPVLVTTGDTAICAGDIATYTAAGGNTILWFDEFDNLLAWGPTLSVSPASSTIYTVVAVTNGCSTSEELQLDVADAPVASAGADATICVGESYFISDASASGYASYYWSTDGDGYFMNPNAMNTLYIAGTNDIALGTVTLTLNALSGSICPDATDDLVLTIQDVPMPVISGDTLLCEGNSGILNCSVADTYLWSTGENTQGILISPLVSQTYSVTTTTGVCTRTDEVFVQVVPYPVANAGNDTSVCFMSPITLTASGGGTYTWSTGDNTASIVVTPAGTQTYIVTVTDHGCSSTDDVTVTMQSLPPADAGMNTEICDGSSTTLTGSGGTGYLWSTGENTVSIVVSPLSDTWYYLTVTDGICENTDSVLVSVKPLPFVDLGPDTTLCPGAELFLTSGPGDSYLWSTGCVAQSIIEYPVSDTEYSVTTTLNGCSAIDTIQVTVLPLIPASAGSDQMICLGEHATLTASGGSAYEWSTGETTQSINVNPLLTTSYVVTVTAGTCTAQASVTVFVQALPIVDAGPNDTICEGNSTILSASFGVSYNWSTGENTQSIVVSPAGTTTYTVTVSDGICENTDDVEITVQTTPLVDVTDTIQACPGSPVSMVVTGADTYLWETGSTGSTLNYIVAGNETILVEGFTNGCSAIDSCVIIAWPAAFAFAGNDTAICEGETALLHATGNGTFEWNTGETTQDILVNPSVSGMYYLTVSTGSCTAIDSIFVTVNPVPATIIYPVVNICPNDSTILSASGGTSYIWSTGDTTADISVSPITDTQYFVTVTNAFGCATVSMAEVVLNPAPHASAGPDVHQCLGDSVTLCAGGGTNFLWSDGGTSSCITVSVADTTVLWVEVSNGLCSSFDSLVVYTHQQPVSDAGAGSMIIIGDSALLYGSGSADTTFQYWWDPSDSLSNPSDASTLAFPDTTTLYTLYVMDDYGCMAQDTVSVIVVPPGIYMTMSPDTFLCSGDSIQIMTDVFLSTDSIIHYLWTPTASVSNDTIFKPWVSPMTTTTYFVQVWDNHGYSTTDSVTVTVYKTPDIDLGPDQSICMGDTVMLSDQNFGTKLWSTGEMTDTIYIAPADTQIVVLIVSNFICSDVDSVIINVKNAPASTAGPDLVMCEGDSVVVLLESGGISSTQDMRDYDYGVISPSSDTTLFYVFENNGCFTYDEVYVAVNELPDYILTSTSDTYVPGQAVGVEVVPAIYENYIYYVNGQYITENSSGIHYFDDLGAYDVVTILVETSAGCYLEKDWSGELIDVPNTITPDGNGLNDRFLKDLDVTIVNRWGQEMYHGTEGWDATYHGEPVDAGTYYYIIRLPNPEAGTMNTINGSLLIIR